REGLIDILATDHAPHAAHEKEGTLDEAAFGFTGLDLAMSLCWKLVQEGILSEADLQRLWCRRPGEIFDLPWNGCAPGDPADFFLWDAEESWTPGPDTLYSKSCNTPFAGQALCGRVKHHWLGGRRIF
ncbi:MAG: dihydroorotase, partial [Desulfovibrionaceae bacterium]|nr:dihydroorotase [Desulfovibrionaceae bacterium]